MTKKQPKDDAPETAAAEHPEPMRNESNAQAPEGEQAPGEDITQEQMDAEAAAAPAMSEIDGRIRNLMIGVVKLIAQEDKASGRVNPRTMGDPTIQFAEAFCDVVHLWLSDQRRIADALSVIADAHEKLVNPAFIANGGVDGGTIEQAPRAATSPRSAGKKTQ